MERRREKGGIEEENKTKFLNFEGVIFKFAM